MKIGFPNGPIVRYGNLSMTVAYTNSRRKKPSSTILLKTILIPSLFVILYIFSIWTFTSFFFFDFHFSLLFFLLFRFYSTGFYSFHSFFRPRHTVAIWAFTFHEKSGCLWGDLEGQFQTRLQVKVMNFLILKFRSIILIFLLFFAGIVKSSAFCTLLLLLQRVEVFKFQFDAKTWIRYFNLFEIALTVSKKHWNWQLLQKIEGKWE